MLNESIPGSLLSLNVQWLREHVAILEQTSTLFAGSIFDNIALAKPGATMDDVTEAAKLVSLLFCCVHVIASGASAHGHLGSG